MAPIEATIPEIVERGLSILIQGRIRSKLGVGAIAGAVHVLRREVLEGPEGVTRAGVVRG